MRTQDLDPKDRKYIVSQPGDFNPARNKAVIEETIEDTEKYFKSLEGANLQGLGERIEAVAAYGCYRFNRGNKDLKEYLGPTVYKNLVGEKIISKLRVMNTVNKLNNNRKYKNAILL